MSEGQSSNNDTDAGEFYLLIFMFIGMLVLFIWTIVDGFGNNVLNVPMNYLNFPKQDKKYTEKELDQINPFVPHDKHPFIRKVKPVKAIRIKEY